MNLSRPLVSASLTLRSAAFVAALAGGLVVTSASLAPTALAEDGEGEGADSVEKKIKEQMDKILKLMRENEGAILAASQGSGKRPAGAKVEAPESPQPPQGGQAPGAKPDGGTTPGARGDEIKKKMEELIRSTQEGGGTIPKELEELVKMIPT